MTKTSGQLESGLIDQRPHRPASEENSWQHSHGAVGDDGHKWDWIQVLQRVGDAVTSLISRLDQMPVKHWFFD